MIRGPRLNNIGKNFTSRDSLGLEGVATSMQGEICPVVTTVTPRAFYWPFMVWIYYDFLMKSGIKQHTSTAFKAYLRRQDYFFVMATLLTPNADNNNLVGKTKAQIDIDNNQAGPYPFNDGYFKAGFCGMLYYNAGCTSLYFITSENPENGKEYDFPGNKLSPVGYRL